MDLKDKYIIVRDLNSRPDYGCETLTVSEILPDGRFLMVNSSGKTWEVSEEELFKV